jgi:fumarylpyruvate hydrolase
MQQVYVFDPPQTVSLPVLGENGSDFHYPVHRIFCIGRNYADHAREMGHDPEREAPFFFMKPSSAIVQSGTLLPFPGMTSDLHYEVELVVAIGAVVEKISASEAHEYIFGYAVGLDMTRRDLQQEAKAQGRPWEIGKAFDMSAPCSAIRRVADVGHPENSTIALTVNGTLRQSATLDRMIWTVPEIVAHLSTYVRLLPGDLIMTGTPAGVGVVKQGDILEGTVEGIGTVKVQYGG